MFQRRRDPNAVPISVPSTKITSKPLLHSSPRTQSPLHSRTPLPPQTPSRTKTRSLKTNKPQKASEPVKRPVGRPKKLESEKSIPQTTPANSSRRKIQTYSRNHLITSGREFYNTPVYDSEDEDNTEEMPKRTGEESGSHDGDNKRRRLTDRRTVPRISPITTLPDSVQINFPPVAPPVPRSTWQEKQEKTAK